MRFDRIFVLVLDGFGVGALPDAGRFGDTGANTLGHIMRDVPATRLPHLTRLGLGRVGDVGLPRTDLPAGLCGKMRESSDGKDTITGHWEMMGLKIEHGFPTYPDGFPAELVARFEKAIGRQVLGNKAASGTEIIKELGPEHERTGKPILYTSADSVFQVAAHEAIIPPAELWRICEIARGLCDPPTNVGRVIARPFTGKHPYERTANRRDYPVTPPPGTLLDMLHVAKHPTYAIGKIWDIFNGRGITESTRVQNNGHTCEVVLDHARRCPTGSFVFANFNDFDSKYGHRNNAPGYAKALEAFDAWLPSLFGAMSERDLFLMTGDHGCDPTDVSTDHTREHVPIVAWAHTMEGGDLGVRRTFSDIAATVAQLWNVDGIKRGKSFADRLTGERSTR